MATDATPWALYGQFTNITQKHPDFKSLYSGPNSLSSQGGAEETSDATLFLGRRLWNGAEGWINAEVDQGFGLSNTLGVAGFPNGGAYKIGASTPYFRIQRLFIRQVIEMGGASQAIDAGPNQFSAAASANNVTITVGKLSVPDIFDANSYAHDPRADFMNWAIIDAGSFDYAADSWGYTYGAAVEWNQDWWTLRSGWFQLSPEPNGKISRVNFSENSAMLEAEERHHLFGHPGKLKLLAWINHGRMGSYQQALQLAALTGTTPQTALVRRVTSRPGVTLNLEQALSADLGAFVRASANRGDKETYEFSDINESLSAGLSLKGERWNRHDDTIGLAVVANRISGQAQQYFEAGGLGLLIGDGRLNYAPEKILETYYALQLTPFALLTLDYQHIANPGYNRDRGPVSVYGVRLHASF